MEHRTDPESDATMILRINTAAGPRTIIASTVPLRDARHIANAMQSAGHYAHVRETGVRFPILDYSGNADRKGLTHG